MLDEHARNLTEDSTDKTATGWAYPATAFRRNQAPCVTAEAAASRIEFLVSRQVSLATASRSRIAFPKPADVSVDHRRHSAVLSISQA